MVEIAGVFKVWFNLELSIAVFSDKNSGMYRSLLAIRSALSIAAGDIRANQRPPSEAKFFCGAK
jgi:hypothetical protein